MRTRAALLAGLSLASLALAAGAAQAADGAMLFKANCTVCHSAEAGQNKIGPSLFGVVDRKSGTAPGYTYSEAMSKAGLTWDPGTLDKYLADPHAVVPNTKMAFLGVKKAEDRKAIIDYLGSLK
jgi:cytochrome c2